MLYDISLRESHLSRLSDILKLVKADKRAYRKVKFRIDEKISEYGLDNELDPRALNRVFNGHSPRRPELMAFIFDFVTIDVVNVLKEVKQEDGNISIILERIDALRTEYGLQLVSGNNPFLALARDFDTDDLAASIPATLTDSFIGYRRGSQRGELIRFYFRIFKPANTNQPFVRYFNRYQRGYDAWNVTGGGVYTRDHVLYLFGHARNRNNRSSLGYRMLALKRIEHLGILTGPIISMNRSGPIGAKITLIPIEDHVLTSEQKNLSRGHLVKHLISHTIANDRMRFEDEINQNLSAVFDGDGLRGLTELISNASSTVLCTVPDVDDIITRTDVERQLTT